MSLFTRRMSFNQADPLGNGLREEIVQEQEESDAITLEEGVDEGELSKYWQSVESDIQNDSEWYTFSNDE